MGALVKRTEPIGVDLGSRYLKLAQLQPQSDGSTTVIAEARELSSSIQEDWRGHTEQLKRVLKEMIRDGQFVGRQVVGCVPDGLLEYRNLRLAPGPERELDSAVQSYVSHQLELPEDLFRTQYFDAGIIWDDDDRRQEIIAMSAPIEVLTEYLSVLTDCGLSPVAIDAVPAAVARSVIGAVADDAPLAVLDIGHQWTSLMMIHQDEIRFVKRVQLGMYAVDQDIADALFIPIEEAQRLRETMVGIPMEQSQSESSGDRSSQEVVQTVLEDRGRQLARHIAKCLQYYSVTFRASRPQLGIVVGGGAYDKNLIDLITRSSRVDFQSVDRLSSLDWASALVDPQDESMAGRWAVAVGLAQYSRHDQAKGEAA